MMTKNFGSIVKICVCVLIVMSLCFIPSCKKSEPTSETPAPQAMTAAKSETPAPTPAETVTEKVEETSETVAETVAEVVAEAPAEAEVEVVAITTAETNTPRLRGALRHVRRPNKSLITIKNRIDI